jgi:hypothetical protein
MVTGSGSGERRLVSNPTLVFGLFSGKMERIMMDPTVLRRRGLRRGQRRLLQGRLIWRWITILLRSLQELLRRQALKWPLLLLIIRP